TSVEIEKATGLRQPEVSIAMQELRRRRWVDKRDIKKEGKGRPVYSYRLSVPWSEILATIDREAQTKIEWIEANRKRLKTFASCAEVGRLCRTARRRLSPFGRRGRAPRRLESRTASSC